MRSNVKREAKLSELFDMQMGKTPDRNNPEYWQNGTHPWISIADMTSNGKFIEHTKESITQKAVDETGIKPIYPGTVIMSFKLSVGKVARTTTKCYSNEAIMAFEIPEVSVGEPMLTNEYAYYLLQSLNFDNVGNKAVMGKTLNKAILRDTVVKYHTDFRKQSDIVSVLDKVSALIDIRKQQLSKLDELVKARFVEMFGDPETNPYEWEQVTVGDVCSSIVRGPFGSALKKEFFVEQNETTYKVYEQKHAIQKSSTIGTYYVTAEKFNELKRFECVAGDILMSCSGTMGELYQLPLGCEKGLINQALCKFTLNDKILPIVFLTYMKQTIGNLETKGSGIQNIAAVSYVKAMPINLPPIMVQEQFAAFVEQVDKSKFAVQQSLDKLETLKKSLMQKYFG